MIETLIIVNAEFPWFFELMAFIFGALVGSFLNVCIYRIPAEKSVVFPGSTCACGQPIAFYNNVPILSWLILRGRAACCGAKFSFRYPAVELLTAVLFWVCWTQHLPSVALVGMLYISFLICSTFIDLDHMIIPDRFSIGGAVIGVLISFAVPSLHGIEAEHAFMAHVASGATGMIGALVGAGLIYWIRVLGEIVFRKPAMGEGDVKFVGFIGAFCGWQGAVFSMFGGALIGSLVLLPILLMGRLFGWKQTVQYEEENGEVVSEEIAMGSQVPFGPMLAAAGLIYFLGFDQYVDQYFRDFVYIFMGG